MSGRHGHRGPEARRLSQRTRGTAGVRSRPVTLPSAPHRAAAGARSGYEARLSSHTVVGTTERSARPRRRAGWRVELGEAVKLGRVGVGSPPASASRRLGEAEDGRSDRPASRASKSRPSDSSEKPCPGGAGWRPDGRGGGTVEAGPAAELRVREQAERLQRADAPGGRAGRRGQFVDGHGPRRCAVGPI